MSAKSSALILVVTFASLVLPRTLLAQYIDPGASSLLWQLLLTALVGTSFMLRTKIGGLIRRVRNRRDNPADRIDGPEEDTSSIED